MRVIKKYWDSVYIYVLLLIPCACMSAGIFWTICKAAGFYRNLPWIKVAVFDCSQLLYLGISLFFILQNRRDRSYVPSHLKCLKGFIIFTLFIQYNFILYLFPSVHVWECTFLFFAAIVFLFDSKLMLLNILSYLISLLAAHLIHPDIFLPLESKNLREIIAFRIVIFTLTAVFILLIVYFAEKFLIQARERDSENVHLLKKQLEHYKNVELLDTEFREFRHDIRNHFLCMESLLQNNKTDELREYFQDLQQAFAFQDKIYLSNNEIVDAILNYDLSHSCREAVEVAVYGTLPELRTVSAMDLCTIFSNLLSNAIHAANQCTELKNPRLTIRFQSGNRYFSIAVSNSIPREVYPFSVKPKDRPDKNHGHGIHLIKGVLEKYDGRFEQMIENQLLTIRIYLPI